MTRLGVVTAILAAALCVPGGVAAQVAPGCGAFDLVATPNGGTATDVRAVAALGASNVWAIGQQWNAVGAPDGFPLAMRWDGSTFVAEPIPDLSHLGTQPALESVSIAPKGDPWVAGSLRDSDGRSLALILRWSGGFWQTHPVTLLDSFAARYPRLRDVAALDENDAWTVGEAETLIKGAREPFVAHWDGTAWSEVAMPGLDGIRVLTAVAALDKAVFAVGYDIPAGTNDTSFARIYQWDGSVWSMVEHPALDKAGSTLQDVVVIAVDDIWAVGSIGSEGLFLHWDGSSWSVFAAPANADPRSVAAVASDDVWAAGSRGHYRWDGKSWSFLPAGSQPGTGEQRAVAAAGPCDVWSVSSTNAGASSASRVERLTRTIAPEPPAAPIGLVAIVKAPKQIILEWLPGNTDPNGSVGQTAFVIERCIGDVSGCVTRFEVIQKVGGKTTFYVDSGLYPNTSYAYRIYAVNDAGNSGVTKPVDALTLPDDASPLPVPVRGAGVPFGPPPAPGSLTVKPGNRLIGLSWIPGHDPGPAGGGYFVIERCIGFSSDCVTRFVVIQKVASDVTAATDSGLQPSTNYTYRVYAVNDAGASAPTQPATGTTLNSDPALPGSRVVATTVGIAVPLPPLGDAPPATPVAFVAKAASAKAVVLSWQSGSNTGGAVGQTEFVIERCAGDAAACVTPFTVIAKVGGESTSFVDFVVKPASTYSYRISAVSAAGTSAPTAPATATTPPLETPSPLPVPQPGTNSRS